MILLSAAKAKHNSNMITYCTEIYYAKYLNSKHSSNDHETTIPTIRKIDCSDLGLDIHKESQDNLCVSQGFTISIYSSNNGLFFDIVPVLC